MLAAFVVEVDVTAITYAIGFIIPVLVALLTKSSASSGLKSILNFGLSALSGVLAGVVATNGSFDLGHAVISFGNTWLTSIATYYGLYRPTGTTGAVASATSGFGLGSPSDG